MRFQHFREPALDLKSTTTNNERWYVTPEGNRYPSITTILGAKEKPAIQEWRKSFGEAAAAKEVKRCTDRGTALHETIERYLSNEDVKRPGDPLTARLFSQTKMMLNRINNIRLLEAALYSDQLRIAGRVDCIAEFDGKLSVIDFKTSNNNKTSEMIEDYKLQCTAYAIMYSMLYTPIDNVVIIIGVEKGLVPQVFQDTIDNYVAPLINRINTFYNKRMNYEHQRRARSESNISNRSLLTEFT